MALILINTLVFPLIFVKKTKENFRFYIVENSCLSHRIIDSFPQVLKL